MFADYHSQKEGPNSTQAWLQNAQLGLYVAPSLPKADRVPRQRPGRAEEPEEDDSQPTVAWSQRLRDMVLYPHDRPELVEKFVRRASPLGQRMAEMLWQEGVRAILVPFKERMSELTFEGEPLIQPGSLEQSQPGFYRSRQRQVVIKEKYLRKGSLTVIHELAHAIDEALTRRSQLQEPLSTILWHSFKETRKRLADGHMLRGPGEYFSVSVELYYAKDGRDRLRSIDPAMLEFLDGFLA